MSSAASRPPNSMGHSTDHSSESAPLSRSANPPSSASKPTEKASEKAAEKAAEVASERAASEKALRQPPSRPHLIGPPARPKPPAPEDSAPVSSLSPPSAPVTSPVIGPISEPSERMQYRAIGLIKGQYIASEEQFNRGNIAIADGTLVDAVLLGRVTSLIKKHIDLDTEHLWVVYPRTLYDDNYIPALHVQIVGVWEPETLNANTNAVSNAIADSSVTDSFSRHSGSDRDI